jgi:hypothetical protein
LEKLSDIKFTGFCISEPMPIKNEQTGKQNDVEDAPGSLAAKPKI